MILNDLTIGGTRFKLLAFWLVDTLFMVSIKQFFFLNIAVFMYVCVRVRAFVPNHDLIFSSKQMKSTY